MRRFLLFVLFAALVACSSSSTSSSTSSSSATGSSSGSSSSSGQATGATITIKGFAFSPTPLKAKAGDTITVTNLDNTNHSVTADDNSFDTNPFSSGSKTFTVPTAGTFKFHCKIHSTMTGEIDVS